ncbi:MAG: DnaB-like helicase C-terminal domain-containing protein [Oscillospiraceae bacterium]
MDLSDLKIADARVAILGSLIIEPDLAGEIFQRVSSADFGGGSLRTMFEACRRIFSECRPIDPVTLLDAVGDKYAPELRRVLDLTPTAQNWAEYCRILHDESRLSNFKASAAKIGDAISLDEAVAAAEHVSELLADKPGVRIVSLTQGVADFISRMQDTKRPNYIPWGFPLMNEYIFAEPGDLVILGGYPSSGKTLLATQFAFHMATSHRRVGIFSLETKDSKLYDRLLSYSAKIPFDAVKEHKLTASDYEAAVDLGKLSNNLHLDVIAAAGMGVADIQAISLAHHYDVIFIDYLQLLRGRGKDRYEIVTNISQGLHLMGQITGITVIALAQLNRPDKSAKNKPPTMSSLRESGQIEQDADIVLLLYLDDEDMPDGDRILKVEKNKEGKRGFQRLGFYPKHISLYPKGGLKSPTPPSSPSPIGKVTAEESQMALPF